MLGRFIGYNYGFTSVRENINNFRRFIKKFSLFSNRSEALHPSPISYSSFLHFPPAISRPSNSAVCVHFGLCRLHYRQRRHALYRRRLGVLLAMFEKRLNLLISLRKLSIFCQSFSNRLYGKWFGEFKLCENRSRLTWSLYMTLTYPTIICQLMS